MSYSFSVTAPTKAEVLQKIDVALDAVVSAQPNHAKDREQARAAAEAFIELLPDAIDDGKDFHVSMNGSIGWIGDGDAAVITGAGVGVSASVVAAQPRSVAPVAGPDAQDNATSS